MNKMYNLNMNLATSGASTAVNNLLSVESSCTTPRTPEILNSLIAMTNPLDGFNFSLASSENNTSAAKSGTYPLPSHINNDSCSNSSASQTESPTSPPSVQHTRSQLIKAGLKLSIESKRKNSDDSNGGDLYDLDNTSRKKRKISCKGEITGSDDEYDTNSIFSPNQGLTPEDEERRRRRRERNKIAATKCRLKKRQKTVNLVQESETLETQNIDLKTQIQDLEAQRRNLVDMLTLHKTSCVKSNNISRTGNANQYNQNTITTENYLQQDLADSGLYGQDLNCSLSPVTSIETSPLSYCSRPASVDIPLSYRQHNLENYNRPASVGIPVSERTNQYGKTPNIIINSADDYTNSLTNLDNHSVSYQMNSQHCHNYDPTCSNNGQNYSSAGIDNGCMA